MQIGCLIIYDPNNCEYLDMVIDQFDCTVLKIAGDFNKRPEHEYRNEGLKMLRDCDYVWIIDADEILFPETQKMILKAVKQYDVSNVFMPIFDYVDKSFDRIYKVTDHCPVVLVNPKETHFYATRCIHGGYGAIIKESGKLHHLGYFNKDKKSFDDGKFEKRFNDKIIDIKRNKKLFNMFYRNEAKKAFTK